jgi:hypothetical protein
MQMLTHFAILRANFCLCTKQKLVRKLALTTTRKHVSEFWRAPVGLQQCFEPSEVGTVPVQGETAHLDLRELGGGGGNTVMWATVCWDLQPADLSYQASLLNTVQLHDRFD